MPQYVSKLGRLFKFKGTSEEFSRIRHQSMSPEDLLKHPQFFRMKEGQEEPKEVDNA